MQDFFFHTVEIKDNQNDLVTFYKIFFCVQQKKVHLERQEGEEMITECILKINALLQSAFYVTGIQ